MLHTVTPITAQDMARSSKSIYSGHNKKSTPTPAAVKVHSVQQQTGVSTSTCPHTCLSKCYCMCAHRPGGCQLKADTEPLHIPPPPPQSVIKTARCSRIRAGFSMPHVLRHRENHCECAPYLPLPISCTQLNRHSSCKRYFSCCSS